MGIPDTGIHRSTLQKFLQPSCQCSACHRLVRRDEGDKESLGVAANRKHLKEKGEELKNINIPKTYLLVVSSKGSDWAQFRVLSKRGDPQVSPNMSSSCLLLQRDQM
jgi:hypothetical protein